MRLRYPHTRQVEQYDDYFGNIVHDPYRWLEEDSGEVAEWIEQQNELTESYLQQTPYRQELRERIRELMNFPRYSSARKVGNTYYFLYNDGLQEQAMLYVQEGRNGTPRVFLDPNNLSEDGSLTLASYVISNDALYMTYSLSKAGSDWSEVRVIELDTGRELTDRVEHVFSPQDWTPHWYQSGFYYSQYGDRLTGDPDGETPQYSVKYHQLGTPQADDVLVYEQPNRPELCFALPTSQDDNLQFLAIFDANYSGNKLYLRTTGESEFKPFHDDPRHEVIEIDEVDGCALLQTNIDAPTYRIVLADVDARDPASWHTIIPAGRNAIELVCYTSGKVLVVYSKDAHSILQQFDISGQFECEIELPGICTISNVTARHGDACVLFEFSGFTTPRSIFEYDVLTRELHLFKRNEVPYSVDAYATTQIFATSFDGTRVPAFIVAKKGIALSGENPTILTGYGGFNLSLTPEFRPALIAFLERGGIFVQANLRGGGEYGTGWFADGSRFKKQNSFDDFNAVAIYLCNSGHTCADKLALTGASHGGLLVGATMIQHPDLCRAAIMDVGVFDMLRFDRLGGLDFARDYGNPSIETDALNLLSYSPLHNLRSERYPAALIRTATHDDRVLPAHSYKFAAHLQKCQSADRPALLRVSLNSGHGKGLGLAAAIEKVADDFAFILHELGTEAV